MQWTAEWVDELLTGPERALRHTLVRVWISRQGGLARVLDHMRAAPLSASARRLLAALLDDPGAPAASYAARLSMHRSTYQRQRRLLTESLAVFLRELPVAASYEPAAPPAAPPPRHAAPGSRLPQPLTPLIGRQAECADLLARLKDGGSRFVSLIGPGGIGKTRVALAVAAALRQEAPAAVWWVDLTPLEDPAQVLPAIARAIGLAPLPPSELLDAMQLRLAHRPGYLFLDNAEHLLAAGPQLSQLLQGTEALTLLVTSRVPLDLYGEQVAPLQPLSLPATPGQVRQPRYQPKGALELFLARAQAANPLQALDAAALPRVYSICRQLDGLPLAIELAAAHTRHLALEDIDARLADCLTFLDNGPRDVVARQRTLRALLDWSYRLLSDQLQRLFGMLGVFHNGWSRQTLAALCPDADPIALDGQLQQLVRYQLVTVEQEPGGEPRYGMLATVRAYAVACLGAHADAALIHERHAQAMLALLAPRSAALDPTQPAGPFPEEEYHNALAALAWWLAAGAADRLLELTAAMWPWWIERGNWEDGLDWCARTLAAAETARCPQRAAVLYGAARLAYQLGPIGPARGWLEEAAALLAEPAAPSVLAAEVWNRLGVLLMGNWQGEAQAAYTRSLELWRQLERPIDVARTQHNLGLLARSRRQYAAAIQQFHASLAFFQEIGDAGRCAIILGNLASALVLQGDLAAGLQRARAGMALARQARTPNFLYNLFYLIQALLEVGELAEARDLIAEAHHLIADQQPIQFVTWLALVQAIWLAAIGMDEEAAALFGAWSALQCQMHPDDERPIDERWAAILPYLPPLRAKLGEQRFDQCWRNGAAMDGDLVMQRAKTLLMAADIPVAGLRSRATA
ncbi:MAG TPA: AAA family ATPase [Herpetosiphonaceae bacterium]